MNAPRPLPPEEDLFVRIVLHNKLATRKQADECVQGVLDEVYAGRMRPSLASVFIERGYLSSAAVAAVQEAVTKTLAKRFGKKASDGSAPNVKSRKAPAGDSQMFVPVKKKSKARDKRFLIANPKNAKSASLTIDCHHLVGSDAPTLEAYSRQLVATGREELNIDMRQVRTVPSLVIGILVKTGAEATTSGQRVVLHCGSAVAKIVRMIAGDALKIRVGRPPLGGHVRGS